MNRYTYHFFEMAQLAIAPARAISDFTRLALKNPVNPMSYTTVGRNLAASAELFERMTRRYGKPPFGLDKTFVDGREVAVEEEIVWMRAFCQMLHFKRDLPPEAPAQPRLLIVAPMSGHYATLLRGTVETFIQTHDVYITDWVDARLVPLAIGNFDLDDYIDYVVAMCEYLSAAEGLPSTSSPCANRPCRFWRRWRAWSRRTARMFRPR